jgi:peptidoglycan/LPS O-acetylase OafA/YrhL
MVVGLSLLNKDKLTEVLNNKLTNKLLAYLGGLSLYIYMLHYPIAILIIQLSGKNTEANPYTFWQIFIPCVAATMLVSMMVKYIMENTILKKK